MFFINLLVDFCFMFDMLLNFVTIVEVCRRSCASRACHAACCASYVTWRAVGLRDDHIFGAVCPRPLPAQRSSVLVRLFSPRLRLTWRPSGRSGPPPSGPPPPPPPPFYPALPTPPVRPVLA